MRTRSRLIVAVSLALPTLASAKMEDVSCDDSARMTNMLTEVLGAERQGIGLRDPETMLEVWVTRKSGDWMIVQNYANGTSCIVAMGEHWEAAETGPA
ncbi:hypothetical protein [Ruegeria sp. AU67]|uniref:hypothetical protein n=1 Tax=Ruegeria sp. AU67 TaxID=2108530 RepID=UPI000D68F518|nr:hypothetical protein [Ruegeria sp. AU67]